MTDPVITDAPRRVIDWKLKTAIINVLIQYRDSPLEVTADAILSLPAPAPAPVSLGWERGAIANIRSVIADMMFSGSWDRETLRRVNENVEWVIEGAENAVLPSPPGAADLKEGPGE